MLDGYNPDTLAEDATTPLGEMTLRVQVLKSQALRYQREADSAEVQHRDLSGKADEARRLADEYEQLIRRLT